MSMGGLLDASPWAVDSAGEGRESERLNYLSLAGSMKLSKVLKSFISNQKSHILDMVYTPSFLSKCYFVVSDYHL